MGSLPVNEAEVLKQCFLEEVWVIIETEEVPAELVLNCDQTAIKIVPSTLWTMENHGSKRVEIVGKDDKRQINSSLSLSNAGRLPSYSVDIQRKDSLLPPKICISQ